jgi:hypothetical protein
MRMTAVNGVWTAPHPEYCHDDPRRHQAFATGLSPWAHLATVGADGEPDVVPVHPCWKGDVLWTMCGTAEVCDDLDTKRRLWDGVFDRGGSGCVQNAAAGSIATLPRCSRS